MQLAVQAAAAVVGFYLGGPVGAQIGWATAGVAWSLANPGKTSGPQLNNLHIQGSSYGAPYAYVWGTFRLGGNIVWRVPELTRHEHSSGGKSGPEVTTNSYTATYAVKICRGASRLLGIWSNGRWVYDNRTGTPKGDLPIVFYDGNPNQQPDPTQESIEGVGNVPADIGYQKVVYTDRDVTEVGNVLPQDNYLVSSTTGRTKDIHRVNTWSPDLALDPAGASNARVAQSVSYDGNYVAISRYLGNAPGQEAFDSSGTWGQWQTKRYTEIGTLVDTVTVNLATPAGASSTPFHVRVYKCREDSSVCFASYFDGGFVFAGIFFRNGVVTGAVSSELDAGAVSNPFTTILHSNGQRAYYAVGSTQVSFVDVCVVRRFFGPTFDDANDPTYIISGFGGGGQFRIHPGTDGHVYVSNSGAGIWKFDEDLNLVKHWTGAPQYFTRNQAFFCGSPSGTLCVYVDPTTSQNLIDVAQVQDTQPWPVIAQIPYLTGGVDPQNLGGPWSLGDGLAWLQDGLISVCEMEDDGAVALSEIAATVCTMCKRTAYDVSRIPFPVRGFAAMIEGPTTGSAILQAILPAYFVDIDDSNGLIKFVPRGQPFAIEVPDADLAARSESGEPPAKLKIRLGNDLELPRQIYIKYSNPAADYQIGTQQWHRQNTDSQIVTTVSVPVVFTDSEARRIVEAWGETALLEADTFTWVTTKKYLRYTPTDVMRVEDKANNAWIDLRVTKKTVMIAEGLIEWEGVRSRASVFAQTGIGGSSDGFVPPEVVEAQQAELALIDGPYPEEGREGVIRVALAGEDRRTGRHATLFKSIDGTNYDSVLVGEMSDTIGEALSVLPAFAGGNVFDEVSFVDVLVHSGGRDLSSTSREEVLGGANEFMIKAEVINCRIAALIDPSIYSLPSTAQVRRLRGFLRGRRGTEWAMSGHAVGDRLIMMPTSASLDALHVDYGRTRQYKAVPGGGTLAGAAAVSFTSNGVSRAPYAPSHLGGGFIGGGAFRMRCVRRARIHNAWLDFVDVPLDEAIEKYRFRIWQDGSFQTVKREVIVIGSPTADYLSADQAADFGSPLAVRPGWSVAQWGVLGWGYEAFSDGSLAGLPLFTPDVPDWYVPPNPDPDDGITTVIDWVTPVRVYSGSMGPDRRWFVQTTTGNVDSTFLVRLEAANDDSPPTGRRWALSTIKGDMIGTFDAIYSRGFGSPSVMAGFTVGAHSIAGYAQVPHNTTIFVNIATEATNATEVKMFCDLVGRPAP